MKKTQMRAAIAMIELIFAIVIMGIVLMSAPMLINTAAKSTYVALQQESIAAASSEIGLILTHHWDEGNTDLNKSAPILVALGNSGLNENGNTGRRAGTLESSRRSFFTSLGGGTLNASAKANFTAEGDLDDIDDFDGGDTVLKPYNAETTTARIGDYVDTNITIRTTVSYISDDPTNTGATYLGSGSSLTLNDPFNTAAAAATSNIKLVNIRLTTNNTVAELNKTIILNAFSCNIGTYHLNRRSFP